MGSKADLRCAVRVGGNKNIIAFPELAAALPPRFDTYTREEEEITSFQPHQAD